MINFVCKFRSSLVADMGVVAGLDARSCAMSRASLSKIIDHESVFNICMLHCETYF